MLSPKQKQFIRQYLGTDSKIDKLHQAASILWSTGCSDLGHQVHGQADKMRTEQDEHPLTKFIGNMVRHDGVILTADGVQD